MTENVSPLLWLIPAAPAAGALLNGAATFWTRWNPKPPEKEDEHPSWGFGAASGWIACLAMAIAFVTSLVAFFRLEHGHALVSSSFSWITAYPVDIPARLLFDELSAVMSLVVTGVGLLIHVYSVGYMAHDENKDRYFTYLNLFAAMMLVLVLGDSLPLLFVGWEGVGLCSYLLIGFWYTDNAKAVAGKKAFIVNRVGDFGFLLGMFVLFGATLKLSLVGGESTLSFAALRRLPALASPGVLTAACLLLFVGACGKSAQFPLYIWLPDAMAGPTPVSALIHAATMVTAGVYMIARLGFLFSAAPAAAAVVAIVGAFTALFAATMGFVQYDVKKVLAYSTVSQLGFMVLAVGAGAYAAGIYHLVTHAFFKALLFLGSGSLIHAMEHALGHGRDPNDIRSMGGLKDRMPWTFWTFVIGWAAIAGVPLFSGFFSKDEILSGTLHSESLAHVWAPLPWVLFFGGVVAAAFTAFYMSRLVVLAFLGKPRMGAEAESKIHESPVTMVAPMAILAALSAVAGLAMWVPHFHLNSSFPHFLDPLLKGPIGAIHAEEHSPWLATAFAVLAFVAGVAVAWWLYVAHPEKPRELAARFHGLYRALWNKWWVDEAAEGLFVTPTWRVSTSFLWRFVDVRIIDGAVNGVGAIAKSGASFVSRVQNGLVQSYALFFTLGIAGIALYLMSRL